MGARDRRAEGAEPPPAGEEGRSPAAAGVSELVAEGLARYRSGDVDGARAAWERARRDDPADPRAAEYLEHIENVLGAGEPLASRPGEEEPEDGGADEAEDDALTVERPGVRLPALEPDRADALELLPPEADLGSLAGDPDVGDEDATRERFPPRPRAGASEVPASERETADLPPPIELDFELGEASEAGSSGGSSIEEALSGAAEALRGGESADSPAGIRARLLADLRRDAPSGEAPAEAAVRRVDALARAVRRELDAGRVTAAAVAATLAMDEQPDSAAGQKRLHEHAGLLLKACEKLFGAPSGVPLVALPLHELSALTIDSRAAFLLSRVDGMLSFEEILDVSGMPKLEASALLARLVLQGIIDVR